jgi:hypothetical protein
MRAKRPFPLERPRKHKSLGVHSPDPLRDDPNHPHSSLGGDKLKTSFATGGLIGETEFAGGGKISGKRKKPKPSHLGSGSAADAATDLKGRALQIENQERAAEGLPPLQPKTRLATGGMIPGKTEAVSSSEATGGFKDGGKIRNNPAPNPAEQKEQNLIARLRKASRTRTPGHGEKSHQNKLQQSIARDVSERDEAKLYGEKRRRNRKPNLNQK